MNVSRSKTEYMCENESETGGRRGAGIVKVNDFKATDNAQEG